MSDSRKRRAALLAEYLDFDGSLEAFAEKTGVGLSLLKRYSTEDKWQAAKAARFGEAQAADVAAPEGAEPQVWEQLLSGDISIAAGLRADSKANVAWLMRLRDNESAPAASRNQAALRLAELAGVKAVEQDLEAQKDEEPLTPAEVLELYGLARRTLGIQGKGLREALALLDKAEASVAPAH